MERSQPGVRKVPTERYYSQKWHDLEVERLWKRVWQMACHVDDIPEIGDYIVYDVAHLSWIVVRTARRSSRPTTTPACIAVGNCGSSTASRRPSSAARSTAGAGSWTDRYARFL